MYVITSSAGKVRAERCKYPWDNANVQTVCAKPSFFLWKGPWLQAGLTNHSMVHTHPKRPDITNDEQWELVNV